MKKNVPNTTDSNKNLTELPMLCFMQKEIKRFELEFHFQSFDDFKRNLSEIKILCTKAQMEVAISQLVATN